MLDVVNIDDEVVGSISFAHLYSTDPVPMHRIIHILIKNSEGKTLLHKRSKHKAFMPGAWTTPVGGHVQAGESYEEAALREAEEELGIKPTLTFLRKDFYKKGNIQKFLTTFTALCDGPFEPNPQEVAEIRFFTDSELDELLASGEDIHPELLFLLEKIRKE